MATIDIAQTVYLRVWTLLDADSAFDTAFPTGRRVHYADTDPWPKKQFRTAHGDHPQIEIDYLSEDNSGFTEDEHYGDYDPLSGEAWAEVSTHTLLIMIRGRDARMSATNDAVNIIKRVLRNAGPTLGLEDVERVGRITRSDRIADPAETEANGTRRRVTTLTIPIVVTLQGNTELS